MIYFEEVKKQLQDISGSFGVEVGGCRCKDCKGTDRYDNYGPFHFYYAGRCLGYLLNGVYNSYPGNSIIIGDDIDKIPDLLKRDISKLRS